MNLNLCYILFAVGLCLLCAGMALRERIPPRAAAALVLVGMVIAMVFMNIALFMSMSRIM